MTYSMTFSEFLRDEWTSSSARSDLVLTALPPDCDDETMKSSPGFCNSVLKNGSYVFIISSEKQFKLLQDEFTSTGFKVCGHSFKIIFDARTMRKRKTVDFPQRHGEIALVAKSKGHHRNGFFLPDFISGDCDEDGGTAQQFASVLNVPICDDRLMRPDSMAPIYNDERSIQLYSTILRMVTTAGASVIDPFGGPLTTALSCLHCSRSCISIHATQEIRYAKARLRTHATPSAGMVDMEAFMDTTECGDPGAVTMDGEDGSEKETVGDVSRHSGASSDIGAPLCPGQQTDQHHTSTKKRRLCPPNS